MARLAVKTTHPKVFDSKQWYAKWKQERTRYSSYLSVSLDQPLREGSDISVLVLPDKKIR